jgi:hypothetical protein
VLASLCRGFDRVSLNRPEGHIHGNSLAPQQFTGLCTMNFPNEASLPQHGPQTSDRHDDRSVEGSNKSSLDRNPLNELANRITIRIARLQA